MAFNFVHILVSLPIYPKSPIMIVRNYLPNCFLATDFSNLRFTDPANDDCEPTKKEGTVDINVHYNGRTYDKETDTTTFQYSYQRLLEKSENVLFGIGNCFPGSNIHKIFIEGNH